LTTRLREERKRVRMDGEKRMTERRTKESRRKEEEEGSHGTRPALKIPGFTTIPMQADYIVLLEE
jgi:hypothetical protein